MTLRGRLAIGLILVLVVLGGTGLAISLSQQQYLQDQLDDELLTIAANVRAASERLVDEGFAPVTERPNGPKFGSELFNDTYVGVLLDGELITVFAPTGDPDLEPDLSARDADSPSTVRTAKGTAEWVRVVVEPLGESTEVVIAKSTAPIDEAFRQLVTAFVVGAAAVLAIVALVAWWVVRLGLRPIRTMTEAADAITAGDIDRRIEVAGDRTEASRLGEALNTMIDSSQATEQRMRQFVADASHELRTPLTTLRGYSTLHQSGSDDMPGAADAMRRINEEARRMTRIVDELLLLAEFDDHGLDHTHPVDLSTILRDVASDLRVVQPDRTVRVDVEDELIVDGDADRLTQAVTGLTSNALRHTPRTTPIDVVGTRTSDGVRVEVRDNGPGLADADMGRIFDRFYRGEGGRDRAAGGAGLGLAIVAAIVEAHSGAYGVDSTSQGSKFWIMIPNPPPVERDRPRVFDEHPPDSVRDSTR